MMFRMQAVADTSARSLSTGFRHSQATRAGVHAANQEALYRMSESDDSKYVQSAEGAAVFVRPKEGACHFVQYDVSFQLIIENL